MLTSSMPASSGIEEDTWLPITAVARLLGLTDRRVRQTLERYVTRRIDGPNGRPAYEIALSSLPEAARVAYRVDALPASQADAVSAIDEPDDVMAAYQRAPARAKHFYDKWARILQDSDGINGRASLEAWTERWNADHPDLETSVGSIYRMRDRIAKEGRISLLLQSPVPLATSTVTDEWMDWFRDAYLTESKLSAPMARLLTLGRARRAGTEIAGDAFPSHHAFLRRLNRETAPAVIYRAREGEKKWNDRFGTSIIRDYSNLRAGQCWVGDTRTWDVFVRIDGQERPSTCYVTCFVDMLTYLPMGWWCHVSAPSTENVLRAMRRGIDTYGLPESCLLDNGREYRNRDFSGVVRGTKLDLDEQKMSSLAARLDLKLHFAIVKNAQAKIIERQFLVMKNSFDRLWPTFKGGNVLEKPERLKGILKSGSEIPSFEEFQGSVDYYLSEIFPSLPCQGAHHAGKTRQVLWQQKLSERAPLRRVSATTSSMLVTRTAEGRIRDRGFHLVALDCWYWAEWMPAYKGRSITLRYDPESLSTAWGYDESLQLIGTCSLRETVDTLVSDGDLLSKEKLQEGIAQRRRERRLVRELIPGVTPRKASELLDDLASAVGAKPLDPAPDPAPIQITPYDHDAARLKRDAQEGMADYSRFAS